MKDEEAFVDALIALIDRYEWGGFTGSFEAHLLDGQFQNVTVATNYRRKSYGRRPRLEQKPASDQPTSG